MLHISICDNEYAVAEEIKQIVEGELLKQNIQGRITLFESGEEFLGQYQIRCDEIMFIDIDMPGITGIDIMKELEKYGKNKNAVLVTGYDQLVLKSLSCRPFQIIRKCDMKEEIPAALKVYLREQKKNESVIEFAGRGYLYHLDREKIEYLEKYRHCIYIYMLGGQTYTIRGNIRDCEIRLSEYGFLRIHVGYIVNLQRCHSIEKNEMILYSGKRLPISREKSHLVKEQFMISRRF